MKRHNARKALVSNALAAAAAEAVATPSTLDGAVLYVDVVKNMPKPDPVPQSPPPPPEFSIFHEDFPALPGARAGRNSRPSTSPVVPDDWTAMLSDNDETGEEEEEEGVGGPMQSLASDTSPGASGEDEDDPESGHSPAATHSSESCASGSGCVSDSSSNHELCSSTCECQSVCENKLANEEVPDLNNDDDNGSIQNESKSGSSNSASSNSVVSYYRNIEFLPQLYEYLTMHGRLGSSYIFDLEFLSAGQRARSESRSIMTKLVGLQAPTTTGTIPPPGLGFFPRMRSNSTGMPLGGVSFNTVEPGDGDDWVKFDTKVMPGNVFGLRGLAESLGTAQRSPLFMSGVYGYDALRLNVDLLSDGGEMHPAFGGSLHGGRRNPYEVPYDVPADYHISGLLGLPQPKIDQMQVELLFYFFYTFPCDVMQLLAAAELAERGWRFHKYERLWVRRQSDNPNYFFRGAIEVGEYNYFNMVQWKILPRHFELDPDHIEKTYLKEEIQEKYGFHPQMSY
ncbi:uncharacterized protein LOC115631785 [Scaptodrosophila lebanonensis]|uniref:Uncharacterized protein LOC115631785 n=1 Tax=Drosophila lebanonensis TaxID=7225 RepID=A0A6J2U818_DROLE|nr:uncharacterized protein LOC115631785 [Scaptodrosophila lebanonensis]